MAQCDATRYSALFGGVHYYYYCLCTALTQLPYTLYIFCIIYSLCAVSAFCLLFFFFAILLENLVWSNSEMTDTRTPQSPPHSLCVFSPRYVVRIFGPFPILYNQHSCAIKNSRGSRECVSAFGVRARAMLTKTMKRGHQHRQQPHGHFVAWPQTQVSV